MLLRATPMTPEIPKLWERFVPRIDEIAHLAEPHTSYGVIDHFDEATNQFDYLAGCSVTAADGMPEGMQRWEVPASSYAVFTTTLATLGQVMGHIYSVWLPGSGYQHGAGAYFERYGENFDSGDPATTFDIYIPVEKLA
jgi:AraC family transcriptional regulator